LALRSVSRSLFLSTAPHFLRADRLLRSALCVFMLFSFLPFRLQSPLSFRLSSWQVLPRIHANDVGREIEVPQKVIAMHVSCEVEIAHGDMRTACAEYHLAVSEARGADLPILKGE